MDLEAFANRISFRFVAPSGGLHWYRRVDHRLAAIGLSLEVANTRLPHDRKSARPALRGLVREVPRMSTYATAALIDKAVATMPPDAAFVNVGLWHGFSFLAGLVGNPDRRCVGIDNFSQFGGPRGEFLRRYEARRSPLHEFHEMDYEEYFARTHRGPIGFYIYDGEHSYRNQLRGLEAAEPFLASGCVVMVDDTNDAEPRQATLDFVSRHPGRYQMLFERRTAANGHPTFWNGITIFIRM